MTNFSQPQQFSDFGANPAPAQPSRTSVMAIMSLVLGILGMPCCWVPVVGPGLGLLGTVFAVAGMVFIGRSQGRLRGKGLAIGGIICSIIALFVGLVVNVGEVAFINTLGNYGKFVEVAQSDDPSKLPDMLTSDAVSRSTKEGVQAFRVNTLEKLGKFRRITPGMLPFFKGFSALETLPPTAIPPQYQPGMGRSLIPLPGEFEKGNATILLFINGFEKSDELPGGKVLNLAVVGPDGTLIWFIDPDAPAK